MAQATLVNTQIKDGQQLLERLSREKIPITAAGWVRETDSGDWYLYLATPLVGEDVGRKPAYHRVNTVIRKMQEEGIWIDLDKKVIAPSDAIGKDLLAHRPSRPSNAPTWFRGPKLGDLAVEEAYIYPPIANSEEAAGVNKR
jgi:hypothetical protein